MAGKEANLAATRRSRNRAFVEAIWHYGGKCACCGLNKIDLLTLDHINGDGKERRAAGEPTGANLAARLRTLGYPTDMQVLCFNCNQLKGRASKCPCPDSLAVEDALKALPPKVYPPAGNGSSNKRALYTEAIVVQIREEYATRTVSCQKLANKYGGSRDAIWHIVTGRTWKHILPDKEKE